MAKRRAPAQGKARVRKAGAKKAARKAAPRAPRPKDVRLPGMDIPKNRKLDRICESLAQVRTRRNEDNTEEKGLLQNALRELTATKTQVYKSHGVELVHVHGDDKVRMRLVDDDTTEGDGEVPELEDVDGLDDDPDEPAEE